MGNLAIKGMKLIDKREKQYNPDLGMEYDYYKWGDGRHTIEVTKDVRGVHPRFDGDNRTIAPNLDEGGFLGWLARMLSNGGDANQ